MLAGTRDFIATARRYKQLFGGAMRQAGIAAAGCLYALDQTSTGWPRTTRTPVCWHCQVNESGTYEGRLIRDQAAVTAVHTVNARARNIR